MYLNFARDWLLNVVCSSKRPRIVFFFMATIASTKTMTSLRLGANFRLHIFKLKSLQLNRVKFSRKSYPRVGMALVLINPLYNLKISDYF